MNGKILLILWLVTTILILTSNAAEQQEKQLFKIGVEINNKVIEPIICGRYSVYISKNIEILNVCDFIKQRGSLE